MSESRIFRLALWRTLVSFGPLLACFLGLIGTGHAQSFKDLYCFTGVDDGATPCDTLVQGKDGTLYETTGAGGAAGYGDKGYGTVFKITPGGRLTTLYSFKGAKDGIGPNGSLVQGEDGTLSGTTARGGAEDLGTVFKMTPGGPLTTLYSFTGGKDGAVPKCLIQCKDGNLYGTTEIGVGDRGTVFKITPSGSLTTFYSFTGGIDGRSPNGVVQCSDGNLYGTTLRGGAGNSGTVFKITPDGKLTTLYTFKGGIDGRSPNGVVLCSDGNLYGTTLRGGINEKWGVVFAIDLSPITPYKNNGSQQGFTTKINPEDGATLDATSAQQNVAGRRLTGDTRPKHAKAGDTWVNPKDGAVMVYIPAGPLFMGDDYQADNPRHAVTLTGYWICRDVVTVGMYRKFCKAMGQEMPTAPNYDPNWSQEDHPIVNVTWKDARAYCMWAGVSLPTDAQWEKASRGTDGRQYPWGNHWDASKCANSVQGSSVSGTAAVGRYADSPYGVSDMAGNVWQWCADWYDAGYCKSDHGVDPKGPASGLDRVLRGGSNYTPRSSTDYFRASFRNWYTPDNWYYGGLGFRCAAGQ